MSIRILVADDEPNQLELLTFNLVQADYEVFSASNTISMTSLATGAISSCWPNMPVTAARASRIAASRTTSLSAQGGCGTMSRTPRFWGF